MGLRHVVMYRGGRELMVRQGFGRKRVIETLHENLRVLYAWTVMSVSLVFDMSIVVENDAWW